jgi:hypothetical protein
MRMSVFSKPVSVVIHVVTMSALSYKWFKIVGVVKFEVYAVVLMEIPFLWDVTMWVLVNSYCHDERSYYTYH